MGVFLGGAIGGYIPDLWGASMFSFSGILCSSIGSLLGLYIAFKYTRSGY